MLLPLPLQLTMLKSVFALLELGLLPQSTTTTTKRVQRLARASLQCQQHQQRHAPSSFVCSDPHCECARNQQQ